MGRQISRVERQEEDGIWKNKVLLDYGHIFVNKDTTGICGSWHYKRRVYLRGKKFASGNDMFLWKEKEF